MMKKFLVAVLYYFMKMSLWFRYRIKVEGLEKSLRRKFLTSLAAFYFFRIIQLFLSIRWQFP